MRRPRRYALLAAVALAVLLLTQHERLSLILDIGLARAQPRYTVADRITQFGTEAKARLQPDFDAAGVAWPGKRVALLAFKDRRRLQLYAQGADRRWAFVRDYAVRAASGDPGPKLREGDRQVPEGFYRVTFLNANSLFHVSLRLDYPNAFDRQQAQADGRSQLGGDIMIHGKAASIGCLAMGDAVAEELFTLAAAIGQSQIEVLIAPTDFRRPGERALPQQPDWLPGLYAQLARSLPLSLATPVSALAPMRPPWLIVLTALALLAFAGNSVLCRLALAQTAIDAASFTSVRLLSGAAMLAVLVLLRGRAPLAAGDWRSAAALFAYAAGFSFAYLSLTAATGALLLFGAVQAGMIGYGLVRGERLGTRQWCGFLIAVGGLLALLLPGVAAPPLGGALLMLGAGLAWAIYSLRGRGGGDPVALTAGNFLRAAPLALLLGLALPLPATFDSAGIAYALASGVLTSALGYVVWYAVLPQLRATHAAALQLGVPVLAALGGVLLIGEPLSLRLLLCAVAILGGIALVIARPRASPSRADTRR